MLKAKDLLLPPEAVIVAVQHQAFDHAMHGLEIVLDLVEGSAHVLLAVGFVHDGEMQLEPAAVAVAEILLTQEGLPRRHQVLVDGLGLARALGHGDADAVVHAEGPRGFDGRGVVCAAGCFRAG